mgnify:CR=1 FL=1
MIYQGKEVNTYSGHCILGGGGAGGRHSTYLFNFYFGGGGKASHFPPPHPNWHFMCFGELVASLIFLSFFIIKLHLLLLNKFISFPTFPHLSFPIAPLHPPQPIHMPLFFYLSQQSWLAGGGVGTLTILSPSSQHPGTYLFFNPPPRNTP